MSAPPRHASAMWPDSLGACYLLTSPLAEKNLAGGLRPSSSRASAEVTFGRGDPSVCPLGRIAPFLIGGASPRLSPQGQTLRAPPLGHFCALFEIFYDPLLPVAHRLNSAVHKAVELRS